MAKLVIFFSDLPGLELAGRTRWGSMGIVNFVNGRGNWLNRMHPDPIGHPSRPVNWTGDGQELVFIGSYRGFGLYDGHGRKVVEYPMSGVTSRTIGTVQRSHWPMYLVMPDKK